MTRLASRRRMILAAAVGILTALAAGPVLAQSLNIDLGGPQASATSRIIQLIALTTVLSVAPSILVMVTSFTRFVVVLGFLRQALGTQQSPPNTVMVSLAMFLTAFVMAPTFEKAWTDGIAPVMDGHLDEIEGFERAVKPFHAFMSKHVRGQDLKLFMDLSRAKEVEKAEDAPLRALIPAFMISELRRAFEIGFLIFLPFLIIDMVIASVLMSMGMMMIPPAMISLPFKLIFFVMVDGWYLVVGSLVQSYG
ncbi:flagellar type III secretion system pore protein FliP [Paramagnetospirillum magneticum]|uniref:Flagellar biosynthetic protein FliP n=1 Tax=Paramagnetospirillum magneticum (strain ATCC 700264 / AMB-1) TaxID=342108 RepID=Q2W9R1_PARM1|nr:flagellar type III secretion system pore protein FliP [Paramagnetospirillum magneticum]BAE49414.1 Flagellar biosynthesis pathway [Paramagnetospirillum magneticum AMB-1]